MARTYRLGPARQAVNRVVVALVRAGTGPADTWLMTVTGRRSGQPRTTPVTLARVGGDEWLVAPYGPVPWVHNVRAAGRITLRRGRHTSTRVTAELAVDDPDGRALAGEVLAAYVRRVRVTAPYFDAARGAPAADFAAEAGRHPIFRLTAASG